MSGQYIITKNKLRKTKVRALSFFFVCALFLFGCTYKEPQYSEKAELRTEDLGEAIMEEWMEKYYPEGEIRELQPYIFYYPSGPSYLTEYVEGVMYDGERDRRFAVNIGTEDVFLEADEDMWEELLSCARELYLASLDLPVDTEIEDFDAYIGYNIETPLGTNESGCIYTTECLPGGLIVEKGDVAAYVNNTERNGVICVSGNIKAENDDFVGSYSREDLVKRQERYQISYSYSAFDILSADE